MGFELKKLIGGLLMPSAWIVLGLILAVVLLVRGRRRPALILTTGCALVFYLLCLHPVADWLLAPIERQVPAYQGEAVDYVVVLGGYHSSDDQIPPLAQLSSHSLFRLLEGIRIHQRNPGSQLVFSGYAELDPVPHALAMKQAAISLGVEEAAILTESGPRDTLEEARQLQPLLQSKAFALVTSASHMPRALQLFKAQGLNPVPAPTEFLARPTRRCNWRCALPTAHAWYKSERAIYERLGQLQQWLKRIIKPPAF